MNTTEVHKQLFVLLKRKSLVKFDEIPEELQDDFKLFFIGKTLTIRNGIPHFHYHDYKEWYKKVVYREGITA